MVGDLWVVVLIVSSLIKIGSVVTEILGVKFWVPALVWSVAYTALYYRAGVICNPLEG